MPIAEGAPECPRTLQKYGFWIFAVASSSLNFFFKIYLMFWQHKKFFLMVKNWIWEPSQKKSSTQTYRKIIFSNRMGEYRLYWYEYCQSRISQRTLKRFQQKVTFETKGYFSLPSKPKLSLQLHKICKKLATIMEGDCYERSERKFL